jgi:hypothetical protein
MEARVAHVLEKEQKGERFTIIDPARLPEKPYKPNRMAIMMIGLVLGIAAGVAVASIKEFTDSSVRSADMLSTVTSFPVLAGIPEITTEKDIRRKKIIRTFQILGLIVLVASGLLAFHFLVMDLNIFWAKLMRRLAL